jgi:hypothetical protein
MCDSGGSSPCGVSHVSCQAVLFTEQGLYLLCYACFELFYVHLLVAVIARKNNAQHK